MLASWHILSAQRAFQVLLHALAVVQLSRNGCLQSLGFVRFRLSGVVRPVSILSPIRRNGLRLSNYGIHLKQLKPNL